MLTVGNQRDPETANRHKTAFGALMTLVFIITSLVFIVIYSTRIRSESSMKVKQYLLNQQNADVNMRLTEGQFIPTVRFYDTVSTSKGMLKEDLQANFNIKMQYTNAREKTETDMISCNKVTAYKIPDSIKLTDDYLCPEDMTKFKFSGYLTNMGMLENQPRITVGPTCRFSGGGGGPPPSARRLQPGAAGQDATPEPCKAQNRAIKETTIELGMIQ